MIAPAAAHHRPRKRFGQNFLVDQTVIQRIVRAIAPRTHDAIVEIGPGLGALTEQIAPALAHPLHAIEIDRDLAERLRARFAPEQLVLFEADALRFDFRQLPAPLRVIGNLPYNISTPLLFHLMESADHLQDLTFMLQKEVVDRICASPETPADNGRLAIMLQLRFACEHLFDVPPEAFDPPPKVQSAIVRLTPLPANRPRPRDETLFAQIVTAAFHQRRKTLRNTLAPFLTAEALAACGIDPTERAERLSVADFIRLADCAAQNPPA